MNKKNKMFAYTFTFIIGLSVAYALGNNGYMVKESPTPQASINADKDSSYDR